MNLEVVDEAGDPIENFVVEFVFNGQPSGEPDDCTVEARAGSNRCGIGEETGYYHMIITAGGFEQLEVAARVNEEGGGICCDSCARPRDVRAVMRARGE